MSTCTHLAAKKLQQFELVRESYLSRTGLPFDEALPEALIEHAAEEKGVDFGGLADDQREAIYTPAMTLWASLSQLLHANEQRACLAAMARVAVLLASREKIICAGNTGAYCRARSLVVVTTRLDAESYSKEGLAKLDRQRWLMELDLQTVKSTLHLHILRCLTPEMARKELYTGILAYKLIRQAMLHAAQETERSPRELSITAAMRRCLAPIAICTKVCTCV